MTCTLAPTGLCARKGSPSLETNRVRLGAVKIIADGEVVQALVGGVTIYRRDP